MDNDNLSIPYNLKPSLAAGSQITFDEQGVWRLEIPAGQARRYRLAQWDDTSGLLRNQFKWRAPTLMKLRARTSSGKIAGTFGFGWWNDPFGMGILSGLRGVRLPVLPQAVWFFYASPQSHLALYEDIPAKGWTASVFNSASSCLAALKIGAAFLPGLLSKRVAQYAIRYSRRFVSQEAVSLDIDITEWHVYQIDWRPDRVEFIVDGEPALITKEAPGGRLGFVLWIDNQYAAILPSGELKYGWLETVEPVSLEISELSIKS